MTLFTLADRSMMETLGPLRDLVSLEGDSSGSARSSGRLVGATSARTLDLPAAEALAERMMWAAVRGQKVGSKELEADAHAYKALTEALSVIRGYGGPAGLEEVLRLVAQATVSVPARREAGAVQIISAQRARARRFDAVFVIGLVEGEFPGVSDEPSLLSTVQRNSLDSVAGGLLTSEAGMERALFIGAATRAWRLLYLSARDAEDDGGEVMPSRFWTEAKALLGVREEMCHRRTLADQVFSVESAPSLHHYRRACIAQGIGLHEEHPALLCWNRPKATLVAPEVVTELGETQCFSPSDLESYAVCPFVWFIERVIGRQAFEADLDGRVFGDLVHSVLSSCYRSLSADGLLPLTAERIAEAEVRADALIDTAVQGPDCPGTAGERRVTSCRLKEMVRRLFQAEAQAGGSLVFKEAEVQIGGAEGVDVGGLRVRGRVDRIDMSPDGHSLFVFDYKSGTVPSVSVVGTGEALQLPLYLLALAAEREGIQVVGGAYLSLAQGELSGVVSAAHEGLLGMRAGRCRTFDETGWRELAEDALGVAGDAAEGIQKGMVAPRPDRVCPSWCDLGPVCRSRQGGRRA